MVQPAVKDLNKFVLGEANPYPINVTSVSSNWDEVILNFSQDCPDSNRQLLYFRKLTASCDSATVTFSDLPQGVRHEIVHDGTIRLTGPYDAINQAMQNLLVTPGITNTNDITLTITATGIDQPTGIISTNTNTFIVPVVSVSFLQFSSPLCLTSVAPTK